MDHRIRKHAQALMQYSLALKPGQKVQLQGSAEAMPLIRECCREALALGAHPLAKLTHEELTEVLLKQGSLEQIKHVPEPDLVTVKTFDAMLTVMGSVNTRIFSNVDPQRLKWQSQGMGELRKIMFERMGSGQLKWCGTLYPTTANAQEASMSLEEYQDFVYGACLLDDPDPVARWREINGQQERICQVLNGKSRLRIVSADTDLSLSVKGRTWVNCSGQANFPDGEVFTSPVEDSAEGAIRFSFPGIYGGREVEDIRLEFKKGKVVKATAAKGQELLLQLLDTDPGARFLGEVAVGTNYNIRRFTRNMLFDEKIGGTAHLAIGRAFPEARGKNESAIHWDMLCDMKSGGKIFADDQIVYQDGKFTI